ncbi:hypothetical protein KM043_017749 [Ampulex compressa]|nr:hypothetical protein KM043_017749 [Ampulex compressa]
MKLVGTERRRLGSEERSTLIVGREIRLPNGCNIDMVVIKSKFRIRYDTTFPSCCKEKSPLHRIHARS